MSAAFTYRRRSVPYKLKYLQVVLCSCTILGLSACRSAFVEASVTNDTDRPISLIEVDYPEASFGTQTLAAHAVYPYRFKIQGSGQVSVAFTGSDGKPHSEKGPMLSEGQEGKLGILIEPGNNVKWSERLMQVR